jgi:hypothetical protein
MKHIAAYLLAQLASEAPSKDDVKKILASVGSEVVDSQLEKLFSEIEGKNVADVSLCFMICYVMLWVMLWVMLCYVMLLCYDMMFPY